MSRADREQMRYDVAELVAELTASGEFVGGDALADPVQTLTVRVRDGLTMTTDGPYIEAKQHLGGYAVVDCDTQDRAVEIAARFPETAYSGWK